MTDAVIASRSVLEQEDVQARPVFSTPLRTKCSTREHSGFTSKFMAGKSTHEYVTWKQGFARCLSAPCAWCLSKRSEVAVAEKLSVPPLGKRSYNRRINAKVELRDTPHFWLRNAICGPHASRSPELASGAASSALVESACTSQVTEAKVR